MDGVEEKHQTALEYLAMGFSVIPVRPGGKEPLVPWATYQDRYPTAEDIDTWMELWPQCNLGIITGKISGISVIDVDGEKGRDSIKGIVLPPTRVVKTPRGYHYYYQYSEAMRTVAGQLDGVDIRSDGGFVVAPPSSVNDLSYHVVRDNDIASFDPPKELIERRGAVTVEVEQRDDLPSMPRWIAQALQNGAPDGERNQTATKLVGYLHNRGIAPDIISGILRDFAARCSPPMDATELDRTIESVTRYQTRAVETIISETARMEEVGDEIRFLWDSVGVKITVFRFKTTSDEIKAKTRIEVHQPGVPSIDNRMTLNWSSGQTRNGLAKSLASRVDIDWSSILDQVHNSLWDRQGELEEVTYIKDHIGKRDNKYLLHPLIMDKLPTIIYGDGGVGKSLVALSLMIALETGENLAELTPRAVKRGLYLDYESGPETHGERLMLLAKSMGLDPEYLYCRHVRASAPLIDLVPQLKRIIDTEDIDFIVVDSAVPASGGDAMKHDGPELLYRGLFELDVSSLIIAHVTKDHARGKGESGIYGSAFWNNFSRNSWEVKQEREAGSAGIELGFYNTKNNYDRLQLPFGFRVNFGEDTIDIDPFALSESDTLSRGLPLKMRIINTIDESPEGRMSVAEVASELDMNDDKQIRTRLTEMVKTGQVVLMQINGVNLYGKRSHIE